MVESGRRKGSIEVMVGGRQLQWIRKFYLGWKIKIYEGLAEGVEQKQFWKG